ncbi:MAG: prepilin-type N-terminal cleavage/methylation domain-containing protein [Candidatus Omnitrophota bacterium]
MNKKSAQLENKIVKKDNFLTGFTLLELIIVVVIIGIMAALAMPQYNKTKERVLQKEAIANIKLIAAAEKIYRMEAGGYLGCYCYNPTHCANAGYGCNALLHLSLSTSKWNYWVNISGADCEVVARPAAIGAGCVYTLSSGDFNTDVDYTTATGCI